MNVFTKNFETELNSNWNKVFVLQINCAVLDLGNKLQVLIKTLWNNMKDIIIL